MSDHRIAMQAAYEGVMLANHQRLGEVVVDLTDVVRLDAFKEAVRVAAFAFAFPEMTAEQREGAAVAVICLQQLVIREINAQSRSESRPAASEPTG